MTQKVICEECGWYGLGKELLRAQNPFDSADIIYGCPKCRSVDSTAIACDEPGCWEKASCGTPTKDGYRTTCGKHMPDMVQK